MSDETVYAVLAGVACSFACLAVGHVVGHRRGYWEGFSEGFRRGRIVLREWVRPPETRCQFGEDE